MTFRSVSALCFGMYTPRVYAHHSHVASDDTRALARKTLGDVDWLEVYGPDEVGTSEKPLLDAERQSWSLWPTHCA